MYSGSMKQGTRVYPLIEESLSCQVSNFFWVPAVYNIKFQKEFQSYHMYSGSIELGTRVYPLIEESLIHTLAWLLDSNNAK